MKRRYARWFILMLLLSFECLVIFSTVRTIETAKKSLPTFNYAKHLSGDGIAILCYHRILGDEASLSAIESVSNNSQLNEFNVNLDYFHKQMKFLKDNNITVLSMAEAMAQLEQQTIRGKSVVITFDDIDRSMIENALPILETYAFPFTSFIITGNTDTNMSGSYTASWAQLKKLKNQPLNTFGLHTHDLHYKVGETAALQSNLRLSKKTADYLKSQQTLYKELNLKSDYMAYPYGARFNDLVDYMMHDGLKGVFTLDSALTTNSSNPKEMPRFIVTEDNWSQFTHWLSE